MSADRIEIEITQTASRKGYVIDDQVQTIILEKSNGIYKIINQEPYDLSDGKNGAKIEEKNIVYYHTNRKKESSDVKLNVYINKMDKEDNLVANLPLRIYSDTLRNTDGSILDAKVITDNNGYVELEKIRVPELGPNGEREDIIYIVETKKEGNQDVNKDNTIVKIKLTFRYNENKEIVELTNAETTWGNRLIKNKTFNGYETSESYESNLYLDIYTNYDDVGNFSIDFTKKDTEGTTLSGAKYDVVILRPDGTNLIRRNLEITEMTEYEGIFVTKGTTIEITEKEAPIGYEINEHTDIIAITDIDPLTGEVTAELKSTSFVEPRTIIGEKQIIPLDDGTIKTNINVSLIDKELNNFKMGITTKDSVSLIGIPEATYRIVTTKGAQIDTPVGNKDGIANFKIGGKFSNETVSYEINQLTTGEYYKKLESSIILNIVFGENKVVDADATMAAQTDPNYGITWEIVAINTEGKNDIDVQIKNNPQDPLTVEVETVDKISLNKIENVSYKITPSVNMSGEGTNYIEVGYVSPNSTKIYNISQITELYTHTKMNEESIKIIYDIDGNIIGTPIVSGDIEVINVNGKTIKIRIKLEPKVPFVFENVGYFNNEPLSNSQFEITVYNEKEIIETGIDGIDDILIGELGTNENIVYHVHQIKAPIGYAKIEDFDIKVHYDDNRNIDNVELVNTNRFVEVSYKKPSESTDIGYNGNEKGIVNVRIKTYPELKINIQNLDRLNNDIQLVGTVYQVESTINTKDEEVIIEDNGIGIAHLDKTAIEETVTYTIKEIRPAALYQTIEKEIKIEVTFDINGYIYKCEVVQGNEFANVSKIDNITTPEDNFVLNLKIKNNKMLKINITSTDSVDSTYYLENNGFEATASHNNQEISKDQVVTDNNGKATLKMDKCLANETVIYTIHQTKKNAGYQFPEEDIKIEITYDSNGKIISDSIRILQASKYVQILNIDAENFNIDIKIVNEETKQFGVNITTIDKYDDTVKLEGVKYNAYLMTDNYAKDENYTGETTTNINGEGYIQFNKYDAEYGQTRLLRLIESNVPSTHREIRASILINIEFNDNGEITNTTVSGGLNAYIGWVADNRFVKVTHTKYTVVVTIMHFPYLNLNVITEDMYTGERLEGKYKISTNYGPGGYYQAINNTMMEQKITQIQDKVFKEEKRIATLDDLISNLKTDTSITKIKLNKGESRTVEFTINNDYVYTVNELLLITDSRGPWVSTGGITGLTNIDYIGDGIGEILEAEYTTTTDGNYDKKVIGVTEQNTSRTFYIYEQEEPTTPMQYQKYRPRLLYLEHSRIIAKITVKYDTKGRIENYTIDKLMSNNNIDYDYIEINKLDGYNLEIKIKYAPITTMEVTTIDNISREPLSNVRVLPYGNSEYNTRQSYEYRTIGYYTTDTYGKTSYTYWGANINEGQNEYHIDTSLMSYTGYYGTGKIKIKVAYDKNGRISSADVISTDENGMPNAEVVGFENNKLKINILYYRKFNIQINKKDLYDQNTKISAKFRVTSNKGETKDINSGNLTLFGIIRPGETVKYTLSELVAPSKYIPLENLDFYVTFGKNGNIEKVWSNNELFESVYERNEIVKTNVNSVKDLEINIKNEPQFSLKINLVDKFYKEKEIPNVLFSIENSKGETAEGNPVTNENGTINLLIGKIYSNEKVIYTIRQTNSANGYREKNIEIKLEVEFNENGKIKDYQIISGNDYVDINSNAYMNQRFVELTAMLTPKDIKLGIKNYNSITNDAIPNVTYKVQAQEIIGGSAFKETQMVTNIDGNVIDIVDEIKQTGITRVTNYTISEINIPNTYRKIQNVILQIRYGEDGRIESSNVISNPSNVIIKVATNGKLQYLNNEDVHILLEIPNDNAYNLIIKNEDKNYQGLGIKDTLYDISINGESLSGITDSNGITKIQNRLDSGIIQIKIAENTIGTGYKADNNNQVTLDIEKGTEEYSLKLLQNSNATYANVTVDSEYGIITVTFKNETKSSLTLIKDVYKVKYKITAKEKLSDGTYLNEKLIGTDNLDAIPQEKLYYELGVTPQNKTIVYTFEEIDWPEDYHPLRKFEVTVEYDIYGHIKRISDNSDRVDVIEEISGSHDIIVIISEYNNSEEPGEEEETNNKYTIKVVSQEIDTNLRINESIFNIEINQGEGKLIQRQEGVATSNISQKGYILEKGVIKTKSINNSGDIYVEVNQISTAKGYIFGHQQTSGTVHLNIQYAAQIQDEKVEPQITIIDTDGLETIVDDTNKEITIKVYNEPEVTMEILTNFKIKNEEGNIIIKPLEGIHYTITSEIQTSTDITKTDLNVISKETDINGKTQVKVGRPYVGKTVIYTISQEDNNYYDNIGDIKILVQYDTKGLIKYYEVVSNPDYVEIVGNLNERIISIQITNKKSKYSDAYNLILEKHHINDEEYDKLIPGITFRIHVKEEYGEDVEWDEVTNEDGLIISKTFNGYGRIEINITEIQTRNDLKLDGDTYTIRVRRDKSTGVLTPETSDDINFEFGENYETIIAKPVNEPRDNSHTIVLNKTDVNNNSLITSSSAEFEVTRIEKENQGTEEEPNIVEIPIYLGKIETDEKGKARLENIDSPTAAGTYTYIIKEIKAPEGYEIAKEEIKVEITFDYDSNNNIVITNANIINGDAKILSIKEKLLNIAIYNTNKNDLNKFKLDINKIDSETGEAIEAEALFKMWLPSGDAMYSETSTETPGKLDKFYLETNAEKKVDLNQLEMPKEPTTLTFTIKEIIAPDGYEKIEGNMQINIKFEYDENQNTIIKECNVDGESIELVGIDEKTKTIAINILNGIKEKITFTVHYDANDSGEGTIVPLDQIKENEVDLILDTMIPTRKGYIFKGWGMTPTSKTANLNPGDIYTLNKDITLYAIWEENEYKITYYNTKDSDNSLNPTKYTINTPEIILVDLPNTSKYKFKGWYTTNDETGIKVTNIDTSKLEDIILYAQWENDELYYKSNKYKVGEENIDIYEDGDIYLDKIEPETTVKELIENSDTNGTITVIDAMGNELKEDELVGTGMTIKITKDDEEISMTTVVMGDLDGNGKVTATDLSTLNKVILKIITLEGAEFKAADLDDSGRLTATDLSTINNVILKNITLNYNKKLLYLSYKKEESIMYKNLYTILKI